MPRELKKLLHFLFLGLLITLQGCSTRNGPEIFPAHNQLTHTVSTPEPISTENIPSVTQNMDITLVPPAKSPTVDLSINSENDKKSLGIVSSFPKISSSTSAIPLWDSIICDLLNIQCYWYEYGYGYAPSFGPHPSSNHFKDFHKFSREHTSATGTHSAYVSLIEKESDIILVAREPSDDEIELAERESVDLEIVPVALDAFVFIVNTQNPVDNLSLDQVRGIYSGEITNWNELGWSNNEITAYQRNENSGSQELMENLVMKDISMIESFGNLVLDSMEGPYSAIGGSSYNDDDIYGIAYSVYFYAMNMIYIPGNNIETIGINMVEPTTFSIQDKSYPLTTEVYAVIRKEEPENSIPRQLRDWILSTSGSSAIRSCGYVPIDYSTE